MSTCNSTENVMPRAIPPWTTFVPEDEYHRQARAGTYLTASMLKTFRSCPAHYHAIVTGKQHSEEKPSFRLGRALHKLVLEGEPACQAAFLVGGPHNKKTGRSYLHGSHAFTRWLGDLGLDPARIVTPAEAEDLRRMRQAILSHREAARLLAAGWPERTAAATLAGLPCRTRFDWLRPDGIVVDLKSTADLDRFEQDARRYGYLNQFAFYRDAALAAGADDLRMMAVVVEKRPPFRVGVWEFTPSILAPYAAENLAALSALRRCREENRWPTGYENTRSFPPASLPKIWWN